MKTYIMPLSNPMATLENVGGKGMSLSKLIAAKIPVPDGFHVTTDAYRKYVEENKISSQIEEFLTGADPNDTAGLEVISQKISDAFASGIIPPEIEQSITAAYAPMNNMPVAVRSSGTAEDLPGASFAGQHDTYLNIQGEKNVVTAIKRCWASLWTARAISYRLLNNIPQESVSLAVVVQRLVYSDASGVLFTANPVNGNRGEIFINSAWGLGEAVVSSLVTPDTAIVDKTTGKILSLDIADKEIMTVRTSLGSEEKPVPAQMRKKASLTKNQILALAKLGEQIETYYAMPMDVEWALEGDTLYIVQARPITILPPEWKLPENGVHYSKGSLAEHLPNPVSPLFATLGLAHVNKAAEILWAHMFGGSLEKLWPKLGAYTTINDFVYLSCNYKPLLIMAKSLSPRSIREAMTNSVPRYEVAQKAFAAEVNDFEKIKPETLTASELLKHAGQLFDAACTYFTQIQLCLPAAMFSETFLRKLFSKSAKRHGISDMSVFLLGFDTASLDAEKSLYQNAEWVNRHPELSAYITAAEANTTEKELELSSPPTGISATVWQEWRDRITQHLNSYGRTCYDYDFAVPTPSEERLPIIESIKTFVSGDGKNPFDRQKEAVRKRNEAAETIRKHTFGLRRWLFKKTLNWAQRTGAMREDAIYHMGMAHPLIRQMLREIANRLARSGAVAKPEDIYQLEQKELETLVLQLDKGITLSNMDSIVSERKKLMEERQQFVSPNVLPEPAKSRTKNTKPVWKDGKLTLTGIGTSAGVITARACVLNGPSDFDQLKPGDVLIAVTTTPAWTPLFAYAGAVVTDIGGPLSHSSIVAREYSIPAVMAVHAASRNIRTGQMVTVDGSVGTVIVHE